jgi:hypothetical protein
VFDWAKTPVVIASGKTNNKDFKYITFIKKTHFPHHIKDSRNIIIDKLVNNHVELLETAVPSELFNVIISLYEMFGDPDNAMQVYAKYKKTYQKFGGDSISTTDANKFNEFFKF